MGRSTPSATGPTARKALNMLFYMVVLTNTKQIFINVNRFPRLPTGQRDDATEGPMHVAPPFPCFGTRNRYASKATVSTLRSRYTSCIMLAQVCLPQNKPLGAVRAADCRPRLVASPRLPRGAAVSTRANISTAAACSQPADRNFCYLDLQLRDGKTIGVPRSVLAAASPVLREKLTPLNVSATAPCVLPMPDDDPDTWEAVLRVLVPETFVPDLAN